MGADPELVIVKWEDSRQPLAEWQHLADLDVPQVSACTTVGWLLENGKGRKVLAQSLGGLGPNDYPQATGIMVIPSRCIISVRPLREATSPSASCSVPGSKRKRKRASAARVSASARSCRRG
jgi:hypothetical protein